MRRQVWPRQNPQKIAPGDHFQLLPVHPQLFQPVEEVPDVGGAFQALCPLVSRAAVDLLLRSRLTEATAFLLDYCNRRWPRETAGADTDFLDAEFAL